jgi:hypothetical protein
LVPEEPGNGERAAVRWRGSIAGSKLIIMQVVWRETYPLLFFWLEQRGEASFPWDLQYGRNQVGELRIGG